jgi:uncharacterized protein YdaU (DUF1376 family)
MNFYAFHIGDYAGATRHLSWDEDMAYRRMLDAYYTREAPLPADRKALYRLIGASEKRQREAVDAVLAEFFYQAADGGWRNRRCDEEIEATNCKKAKAAASANRRWTHERALQEAVAAQCEGTADAMRTHMRTHMPTQSEGNAPNPNPNPMKDDERIARASGTTFEDTERAIRSISEIGIHPVAANAVIAPIWQLVQRGFDMETQILPSIRRQLGNARKPIKSWAYFVDGIVNDAAPITTTEPTAGGRSHGTSRHHSAAQQLRDAIADVKATVAIRDPAA